MEITQELLNKKMTSLKEKLKTAIRLRGYVSNSELYEICRTEGAKVSAAERRLREMADPQDKSFTPEIVKDEWGNAIHGYRWKDTGKPNLTGVKSEFVKRFLATEWRKPEVREKTLF